MIKFPKLNLGRKEIVAVATIFAILLSVVFADWFVKTHRRPASTLASAAHTAPAHVDNPQPQVQQFRYAIQPGDRMWFLAKASCGNALKYREMATANGIPNPNWIVARRDVLTVLPKGCTAVFTPKRAVVANHARSAIADSETGPAHDEPPASPAELSSAPTQAIPWHAPAFDPSLWSNPFDELAQQPQHLTYGPERDAVSDTEAVPLQANTSDVPTVAIPAPKGRMWYVIHLNSVSGRPMPIHGIWQALVVKNRTKPRAKDILKYRTGVVVIQHPHGADVFAQFKRAPSEKDVLLFMDGNGQRFRLRGQYMVANGSRTEFGPAALPRITRADYAVIEKVFPVTEGRLKRVLVIGAPIAINTAVGFAAGGPIGVAITDGIYGVTSIIHHQQRQAAQRLAEAQPQ